MREPYSWFHENNSISVHSKINTIFLSLSTQDVGGTVFSKHTVQLVSWKRFLQCTLYKWTLSIYLWVHRTLREPYSWFHENGSFSVHSINEHYLSIPEYTGRWGNRFQNLYISLHLINKEYKLEFIMRENTWTLNKFKTL